MAVLFVGAEVDAFRKVGSDIVYDTTAGRFDPDFARGALRLRYDTYLVADLPNLPDEFWIHFKISLPNRYYSRIDGNVVELRALNGDIIWGLYVADGEFQTFYWGGFSATEIEPKFSLSGDESLDDVDLHYIYGTSGLIEAYFNGILVSSYSADTTTIQGGDRPVSVRLNASENGGYAEGEAAISEFVIADEPTINWRVASLIPNAAGTTGQWSGAYTDVDEFGFDATDAITTGTAGDLSTFALSNLSTAAAGLEVKAVAVAGNALAGTSGPQNLEFAVRSGGADYFGATKSLTAGFKAYQEVWNTDPATGVKWTVTDVDALEAGVRAVA